MAAYSKLARRANPLLYAVPSLLKWPQLGFRSICGGRLGFMSASASLESDLPPAPPTKVLESFSEEFEIGSRLVKFETGKLARFANGAVVMGIGETKVLSTVTSAKGDGVRDFLPLSVEYQEKQYAQGVIPTTFMRREGAPKERELICGRLIDRPIRPLFPAGFYHEVQVMASVLSSDGNQDPDIMAANATSAALMLSDIPWGGPIGIIRIGRIDGQFVINPTMDELVMSDLNLVYACTREKTLMIDVQAREISERDLEAGLRIAYPEAVKFIQPQISLAAKAGKAKKVYKLSMVTESTLDKIRDLSEHRIESVFTDPSYGKFERGEALDKITQDVRKILEDECDEESLKVLPKVVDSVRKNVVRKRIIKKGLRVDGRRLDEVRPIYCESGTLPRLHGSAVFSRGDTQVLCTVTLGAPGDAQRLDSLVGPPTKRFMLHYSFPPFSINEVGKRFGLNRREVGHGTLAEKALLAVLPPEDNFPYTVRINSEVMASDGSTSMATVCGGSMALMDAGIPLREHVAGVSVGLVSEVDPSTGVIKDYRILTDILGLEDHLGDMDFKIAGTRKGITAIQLDIKPAGIPLDIICESLYPALQGRLQILDHMEREINSPRLQGDVNSPQILTIKVSNDSLRRFWPHKKRIEDETGARLSVNDGTLTVVAKNQPLMEKILEKVYFIVGRSIEIGGVYKGVVSSIKEYGAFVEFNGGQQGLLHISELSHDQVSRVSDFLSIGQELSLMCIGQDVRGNIKLSLKATLPLPHLSEGKNLGAENSNDQSIEQPVETRAALEVVAISNESPNINMEFSIGSKEENSETVSQDSVPPVIIRSVTECEAQDSSTTESSESRAVKSMKSSSLKRTIFKGSARKKISPQLAQIFGDIVTTSASNDEVTVSRLKDKQKKVEKTKKTIECLKSVASSLEENNVASAPSNVSVTAKTLKLGDRFSAKVRQVRAHGLVLELGNGIRGMYRFEENGRKNFDVADELQVVCSSFSTKGIPVMSLLENEHQWLANKIVDD